MTSIFANSTFRLKRASRVVLERVGLRKRWPAPDEIDRMTFDEREAWFGSLHVDERIASALAEYRALKSESSELPNTPG